MEDNLITIYKGCLFFGLAFSILTLICGNFLDDALDGIFDAIMPGDMDGTFSILVTFLSVFGGIGLLCMYNTSWEQELVMIVAILAAIMITSAFYFLYLKPMKENENSVAFSLDNLLGCTGEVTVPISQDKYGEVFLKAGVGNTHQIASTNSKETIPSGTIVVVEQIKDGVLFVAKYDKDIFKEAE